MCLPSGKSVILCTCDDLENKRISIHENMNIRMTIKWTLFRFIKEEWSGMDGMLIEPAKAFSITLTDSFFRDQLNTGNCFDFDYQPKEGDCIMFDLLLPRKVKHGRRDDIPKFISLIYRNQSWIIEQYDSFYAKLGKQASGFIKLQERYIG